MQSITSAPEARSDGIAKRQKIYLAQMGVRVVAFIATVATWGRVPMWASVIMVACAVVLPYTAVLLANEARSARGTATGVPARQLGAAPTRTTLPPHTRPHATQSSHAEQPPARPSTNRPQDAA